MSGRNKLWILNICVVVAALFSFVYIVAVGNHYTLHTNTFLGIEQTPEVEVSFENDRVVRLTDVRIENGELVLDFEALDPGETSVHISRAASDNSMIQMSERTFKVTAFHTLIDITQGAFSFNGYQTVIYAILAVLFIIQFVMLWMFSGYRKKGDFSYPMIACGGIGIYNLALFSYLLYKLLNNVVDTFNYLFLLITDTGTVLLLGLTPIMLIISVLLAVSNIWLIRHEGRRLVNTLGIVFAIFWLVGMVLTLGANTFTFLWMIPYYDVIWLILEFVIAYFECMFLSTVACTFLAAKYTPAFDRDYIIILGCAIRQDGSLTPLLKGRVDSAVAFEKKQYEQTGKHSIFVPSGGQGSDEVISEGAAMERYLLSIGISAEQILREDKSVNTMQNMKLSREVIERNGEMIQDKKVAFATTNYHVFRGYILAKKNGFEAKGISAKTKAYFFPNAFLREFIGLLVDQRWRHIAFVLLTIVVILSLFFMG